jgi:hypothetical protein
MTTITRSTFLENLRYGVKLDALAVSTGSRDRLAALDRDGDGRLRGAELRRAFAVVDSLDRDGSSRSFAARGRAGRLYDALLDARRPGPYHGLAVAKNAIAIAAGRGGEYARPEAPTSDNPDLAGNRRPGRTRLTWLAGLNKCNQFVGDVLWRAGLRAPSYRMPGGGRHYVNAEALPAQRRCFDRVPRIKDLRVGDVIVIDVPGRGRDSAHAEIITHLDHRTGEVRATGAHADGAYETRVSPLFQDPWGSVLHKATHDGKEERWSYNGMQIYLLRPRLRR